MSLRKGVLSLAVAAVMGLAVAAPAASAQSLDNVTGGQTSMFVTITQVGDLARKGIFVSPISPAFLTFTSAEGPAIRFPIDAGGTLESSTMLGTVNHNGGMLIQKIEPDGTVSAELEITQVKIVGGASLVGNALGLIPAPAADLVNASHSKDQSSGVIHFEADARINAVNALVLNTYFSTDAFTDGMVLGRVKSDIETKKVLGL